ncbi:unnamed protein product [Rangifer tarandus platyrhynchus]|uniref:Uncharacterized protein n=1 Tax=Rangifer tarandus platyrhynchus TaxID=3082113 RepID=A0AC59ZL60_RANTA
MVTCRPSFPAVSSDARLEEFLNQSPFYFWINGDRIDSLMENDRQQSHAMDIMEDSINQASNIMNELFQDQFFPQRPQDTQYYFPFSSFPRQPDANLLCLQNHLKGPDSDCSANNPTQTLLRQQLNASLQLAEKFSRLYSQLLQSYQQKDAQHVSPAQAAE